MRLIRLIVLLVLGGFVSGCRSPQEFRTVRVVSPSPLPAVRALAAVDERRVERMLIVREGSSLADPSEQLFVRAREAYRNGDLAQAMSIWRSMLASTNPPPWVKERVPWLMIQAAEEFEQWSEMLQRAGEFQFLDRYPERFALAKALRDFPAGEVVLPSTPSKVALELHRTNLVTVAGQLQGVPVRLFVDTGFSRSYLSRKRAEQLGLHPLSVTLGITDSNGRRAPVGVAVVPEIRVGDLWLRNWPVVVGDTESLEAHVGPVDLVLGWDVLQHMRVSFDFPARQLILEKSRTGRDPEEALSGWNLPLIRVRSPDGHPLHLMLDSGFSSSPPSIRFYRNAGLLDSFVARERFRRSWLPSRSRALSSSVWRWSRSSRDFSFWFGGSEFQMPRAHALPRVSVVEWLQVCDGMVGTTAFLEGTLTLDARRREASFRWGQSSASKPGTVGH